MKKIKYLFVLFFTLQSCVSDTNFSVPKITCEQEALIATHTIAQVKSMAGYGVLTFDSDIVIEGYVISSDASGNMYKELSIQDKLVNPTSALRVIIDKTNLYAVFPIGRKIFIKLKGLSIGYNSGGLVVGKGIDNEIERIPTSDIFNHFVRSCDTENIQPIVLRIGEINDSHIGMLVQLDNVQFKNTDIGKSYGELNSTQTVQRVLQEITNGCEVNAEINVSISGFSDFKNMDLPSGKGEVVGVLTKYYSDYQLILRDEYDVGLSKDRCVLVNASSTFISYNEIVQLYVDKVFEFGVDKEYVFEGYVISSDQEGNFINRIFIQDKTKDPTGGFQVLIESDNIFEEYQIGDKVLLRLNYLYLDKVDGVFTIGVFKDDSVGEIQEGEINNYLFNSQENYEIEPIAINIGEISDDEFQNTLVTISEVQLLENELGKAFAYYSGEEDGSSIVETCGLMQKLEIETLGTASFSNAKFPIGKGSVTGVMYRDNALLKLQLRSLADINFYDDREKCPETISKILITEVADPENNVSSRFIELYNAGDNDVLLDGWKLNKYLNGSQSPSAGGLDLSGLLIKEGGFLIIANTSFEDVFMAKADLVSSYISGNGDDVYELVDENGKVHDVFGVKGEDGTGTQWEYLDGKSIRELEVHNPNDNFTTSEWKFFTKTNGSLQKAPENFSPRER